MTAALSYTLEEASRVSGISTDVLRKLHNDGRLPFRYVTSKPLVKHSDLEALLDNAPTERRSA